METQRMATVAAAPDTGAQWDRIAPAYDRTNTVTQMVLAHETLLRAGLKRNMRLLDVAAGSGALSVPAARLGAKVIAVDRSPVMLQLLAARARREGLDIETRVMDGHALDLDDDCFDLVASQFGVMLFPDMPRALREMARVTAPGGTVLMVAYGDPDRIDFLHFFVRAVQSVRPAFEGPPEDEPPLEFQLADPERLRSALADAGLVDVRVETITETTAFDSGQALWEWIVSSNPIVERLLDELEITPEETRNVRSALDAVFDERRVDGVARLTNPVNVGLGIRASR